MGCAASRLEDEEAVKMCRDRRDFIKQALDQRNRFASSHIAYIESMKCVSMALQRFVAGDDRHELIFDPFISPVKQQKPEMLGLPYGSYEKRTVHVAKYLMSGPNPSVSVEEAPRPVETIRVESHYPVDGYGGTDRFFPANSSPMRPSSHYTPYDRPSYVAPSPQEPVRNAYYMPPYDRPSYVAPSPQEPVRNAHYMPPYERPNYVPSSPQDPVKNSSYYMPPYAPSPQEPVRNSYYMPPYEKPNYVPPSPQEPVRNSSYYTPPYDRQSYPPAPPQDPRRTSFYASHDRPNYPPSSPQEPESSPWDSFWNPFSSLDSYPYPRPRSSYDNVVTDDELARLQRVREEEGIPELEEEDDECQKHEQMHNKEGEGEGEDDDDEEESDEDDDEEEESDECEHSDDQRCMASNEARPGKSEVNVKQEQKGHQSKGVQCAGSSEPRNAVDHEIKAHKKELMRNKVANAEETPGFTVYLNRRPTSLVEAMKDIDSQFLGICSAAQEVSRMLEASRAQYSTSNDLSVKMLNPVALLRSASIRSSSSRFLLASSGSIDDLFDNDTSSCYSEESCSTMSGSHHSTLDRLYTWEKKLYKEVKVGERLRLEYEKRMAHLRNQDVKGEEPSSVDKTRSALRSLQTRMKVSIQTVQSISRRIEVLRDEELHPQLMELIQGLSRMWRAMAERHEAQKRTIDDAKLLFLQHRASAATTVALGPPEATTPPPAAVALECEVRAWRGALDAWLSAQRAYTRALAAWARRCLGIGADAATPRTVPPAFLVCMEWGLAVEAASEARVMDGLDFFVAGVGSVCSGAAAGMEGMAGRVLCAGLGAVTGAMAEFAAASADGYDAAVSAAVAARAPEGVEEENAGGPPQQ
ncbi:protein ROLLING AND ERECT LEAF 2-like [Triticum dicoccoides]|uniref:protein ROLLING AND ERECT LEAF 2-like n=1 Tax=Triticum dicoccoides TaxID=85692 RepID=UPI001891B097|nr:protein ROLLING AND ERECT LEAF 2-like [Triticum dicoccoides]XP_037459055.1 protein ROLLING AND ERECT LEAF 2-like [Triticum dicoccoides]XP_037459056.1 protein ROLLING AND ERECT LEAF 2-like [Triticum dicoccoides]